MEDYPRTLQELESLFASKEACRDYLARLRWPHGFVCSTCEGIQAWCTGRGLWMCGSCGHQTSVTAGTLFQDTRTSLVTWFRAVWWVVSQKNGASALELQRVLGLAGTVCPGRSRWTKPSLVGLSRVGAPARRKEGACRHWRGGAWPCGWPDPNAARGGFLGGVPACVRTGSRRAGRRCDHRRVAELPCPPPARL